MKEVFITDEMFLKARDESIKMGCLRNSIRNGEGNIVGFLGEFITQIALNCIHENTYD